MSNPTINPTLVRPTNGLATAALVLGIVAIAGSFIPWLNIVSILLAVVALILALVALPKARRIGVGTGKAVAGLILGVVTIIIAIIVLSMTASAVDDATTALQTPDVAAETELGEPEDGAAPVDQDTAKSTPQAEEDVAPETTAAQDQALRHAEQYLDSMAFSKAGLITQLTDFEGHEQADAEFGVSNVDVDWNEQAALKAQEYLDTMAFSREGLMTQLVDFEGFTEEEAAYGVDQAGL